MNRLAADGRGTLPQISLISQIVRNVLTSLGNHARLIHGKAFRPSGLRQSVKIRRRSVAESPIFNPMPHSYTPWPAYDWTGKIVVVTCSHSRIAESTGGRAILLAGSFMLSSLHQPEPS